MPLPHLLVSHICPLLGIILSWVMFAAPVPCLQKALEGKYLGELNPFPWAFMTGNTCGWVAYAFLTKDIFVLVGNAPSFLLSLWLNIGACQLQYWEQGSTDTLQAEQRHMYNGCRNNATGIISSDEERALSAPLLVTNEPSPIETSILHRTRTAINHKSIFLSIGAIWLLLLSIVAFSPQYNQLLIVGYAANINLLFFLAAPLSTIHTVLRNRSSKSLHGPTLLATVANCSLW